MQRFHFNSRMRKSGEKVATYLAELHCIAEHCNFGASLDDMLRDRLVVVINDAALQRRLLSESRLNLKKATEIALAHETARPYKILMAHHNQLIRFSIRSDHDLLEPQIVNLATTAGNPITRLLIAIIKKLFVITVRRKEICRSKAVTKSSHSSGKRQTKPTHFVDDEQECIQVNKSNQVSTIQCLLLIPAPPTNYIIFSLLL